MYLLGSLFFIPCTVWMALSPSYISFAIARVVAGLVSSFSQTVPPATITDIFVKEVRGSKMSMFGVAVVIAPAVSPLFCGLIVNASSWRNLFWLILGLAGLQFVLFFIIVPETLWNPDVETALTLTSGSTLEDDKGVEQHVESASPASSPTTSGHVGAAWMPWQRPAEYMRIVLSPVLMVSTRHKPWLSRQLRFLPITLTSLYYGSIFAWSVGITIVWPQKAEKPPYSFAEVPLGASFLAFGIGGLLGKWSGGIVGDKVVQYFHRKTGHRQPEHRLWALVSTSLTPVCNHTQLQLPILPLMLVSCCIIGLAYQRDLHYMLILVMGGLFFFALSAATGILQTYVLETYLAKSMDAMAVFNLFKSMWGFAISFFVVEPWATEHGYLAEYATQGCLAAGLGGLLCLGLLWRGLELRRAQGMPVESR
mgnify:CR=1 FL=1